MARLERASFGSKLGVILATAGSAVGLGNIWRFPYMAGQNGGAVFIMIYIFCVLVLGIPCMISGLSLADMVRLIRLVPIVRWLVARCGR